MGTIAILQLTLLVLQIIFAVASFIVRTKSKVFFDRYDKKADKLLYTSFGCCILIIFLNIFYMI